MEKQIETQKEQTNRIQLESQDVSEIFQSDLIDKYYQIMGNEPISAQEKLHLISQLSANRNIEYEPHYFHQVIEAKVIEHMPNYQIVTLKVYYGYFRCRVTIYCLQEQSRSHCLPSKQSSKSSTIFFTGKNSQNMVIKCFHIVNSQNYINVFAEALKQFCLLQVAECIGVGPKLMKHGGFDMIISQNCIEFGMEKCTELNLIKQKASNDIINEVLIQKLKILHVFQFVHVDIKPSNIMYSEQSLNFIFIDFGFSKLIKQKLGQKTKTSFAGTIKYSGPQMRVLLSSKKTYLTDLYYNDAYCLQLTLNQIGLDKNQSQIKTNLLMQQMIDYLDELIFINQSSKYFQHQQKLLEIKMLIYQKSEYIFTIFSSQKFIISRFGKQILQFILQFPYYMYFDKIFKLISSQKTMRSKGYIDEHRRRIQFKKQKLFQSLLYQKSESQSLNYVNTFLRGLKIQQNKDVFEFSCDNICLKLEIKQNLSLKLVDIQSIEKMSQKQYYLMVAKVVDLRSSQASFKQKIKIVQFFKQRASIKYNIQTVSKNSDLEWCFKILLNVFSDTFWDYFEEIIPLTVVNLVIMEAISVDQIIETIEKVKRKSDLVNKVGILLFRMYFIYDWILEKVQTQYSRKQMYRIDVKFNEVFEQLIYSHQKNGIIKIIYYLKNCSISQRSLPDNQFEKIKVLVQQSHQLTKQHKEQILSLALVEKYKQTNRESKHSFLQMVLYLHEFGGIDMSQIDKIDVIHVQILNIYPQKIRYPQKQNTGFKPLNKYQRIMNCMLEANIIQQFSFYHYNFIGFTNELLLEPNTVEQFFKNLIFLIEVFQKDQYKSISPVIQWVHSILARIIYTKNDKIIQRVVNNIKLIINRNTLDKLTESAKYNYFTAFYNNICYLCELFYMIYPNSHPQLSAFKYFLKIFQGRQFKEQQCQHCILSYKHAIKNIKLTIYLHQDQTQKGVLLCLEEITQILRNRSKIMSQCGLLQQFLGKLVVLIDKLSLYQAKIKYSNQTFVLINQNNFYELMFNDQFGKQIYMFISNYTLVMAKSIPNYIKFHLQILSQIQQHPFSMHADLYDCGLNIITQQRKQLFKDNINTIMISIFSLIKQVKINNPYVCLFFSFFLQHPVEKHLQQKIVSRICRWVDLVSLQVRVRVMKYLIQFLFQSRVVVSQGRSKRRKMLMFANYLTDIGSFKNFSRKVCWKITNRPGKKSKKVLEKERKFYENLQ